ncbi:MAG: 50S ribosomal protein L11 methyltransferase [Eubacteriales bacterium]|nr:50S ribosomal protein L11 methyltransferase [Eubacteriales bacterium]
MKWYEVTLVSTHEGADLFADALFSVGCGGVSIYDKQDIVALYDSDIVWDYIDENLVNNLDDRVFVKGIIGEEEKTELLQKIAEEIENLKKNSPFNLGSGEIIVNSIDDEDWKNEWKKYYKPIVTKSVTVVPVWIKYNKISDKEKILWINPGMAFGTGEHETTKMCLDLLGEIDVSGKTVIDVGTGSGILGIASILSGAKSADMCDIDSTAIDTAKENARLNSVSDRCEIERADLLEKSKEPADVVFANITADILIRLSKDIGRFLKDDGTIILSGIIHARLDEVKSAYEDCGFKFVRHVCDGEWNALEFKK